MTHFRLQAKSGKSYPILLRVTHNKTRFPIVIQDIYKRLPADATLLGNFSDTRKPFVIHEKDMAIEIQRPFYSKQTSRRRPLQLPTEQQRDDIWRQNRNAKPIEAWNSKEVNKRETIHYPLTPHGEWMPACLPACCCKLKFSNSNYIW